MRMRPLVLVFVLAVLGGASAAATPSAPHEQANGFRLVRLGSCGDLIGYGLEHALPAVGSWGLPGTGRRPLGPRAVESQKPPAGRDFSTTNVQEDGVDEPDIVKTDGSHLYAALERRLQIVSIAGLSRSAELPLPEASEHELLLHGDRLLVLSRAGTRASLLPGGIRRLSRWSSRTTLTEIDVGTPSAPKVVRTVTLDGAYLAARLVDGIVRLVTVSSLPATVAFEEPRGSDEPARAAATARNRELLAGAGARDWLPQATVVDARSGRIERRPLVQCRQIWRPAEFAGLGLVTVTTLDAKGLRLVDADAVLADAEIVYASRQSLYLATERWRDRPSPEAPTREIPGTRTVLHKFGTGGRITRYRGSGAVEGFLLSQWSLDEHEDVLRVASTERPVWWAGTTTEPEPQTFVTALAEQGGKLVALGRLGELGRGERVYAVRFVGDLGYVVTFRRIDPLYAVDLSRPTRPVLRGKLEVPGYSAYLHPMTKDLSIGIGQAGDDAGGLVGTQLSLFDVADPRRPKRLHERRTEGKFSAAEVDHHAFLYWPPARLVVIPVYGLDRNIPFYGALGYRVDRAHGFEPLGRVSHGPAPVLRSLVAGDSLYTVSLRGVKRNGLRGFAVRDWIAFE
jgi:uncharacterized secreted protein with C-terminal beta-propeller domain